MVLLVLDPTSVQMNLSFPENEKAINSFIDSIGIMQYICDFVNKGDFFIFKFKYKKVESKTYSDEVYKALMKK